MVEILDCTLRDGSYAIDFQFSANDTSIISGKLDRCGINFVEVGHGIGMGASRSGKGQALCSDNEYMSSATGNWGMFCIPGIATLNDVDAASDHGMKFIRIGCEVGNYKDAEPFIKLSKKYGMVVFSNLMKSYAMPPDEFGKIAGEIVEYGADYVYIVDSSGGMMPNEIKEYTDASRNVNNDIKLCFHGHNNLGMAVSNALYCTELGFSVIDTTLQGIGRSSGNVPTEQFICVLYRNGLNGKIDPISLMEIGEQHIRPLLNRRGLSSLDTIAGLANFHSSYMNRIIRVAAKHFVDPRELIIEVSKYDVVNADIDVINKCLSKVSRRKTRVLYESYTGEEQS